MDEWNGAGRGYVLRYQQRGVIDFNQSLVINDENAVSFQLTGLQEWTAYDIQLAAFNRVGRSNFSETVVARTRESGMSVANPCQMMIMIIMNLSFCNRKYPWSLLYGLHGWNTR